MLWRAAYYSSGSAPLLNRFIVHLLYCIMVAFMACSCTTRRPHPSLPACCCICVCALLMTLNCCGWAGSVHACWLACQPLQLGCNLPPRLQAVEDALCLVFLEHQFADLLQKEGADKMVDIVRKTWGKMGQQGRAAALQLQLPADQAKVVQRALSG
eukprot:GHRQ01013420.1.p2 GENE.GHRQ01013420.1~~GHRQ01013420.1.p2  ORF type:complete len:156 (+),score=33.89 GHRQ01013420.1:662-1129(+)